MDSSNPIRIATHDGSFHADEVLALAILIAIYPDHHVIRTRDPDTIEWADVVIDVGGIYDHNSNRYDHHMPNPPRGRDDHVYSSAGLIWRHYWQQYLNAIGVPKRFTFEGIVIDLHTAIEKHIRYQWIEPIDRNDNGVTNEMTSISVLVQSMRPIDPEKSKKSFDAAFMDTVSMVSHIFKRSCFHAADHTVAQTRHFVSEKKYLLDNKIVVCPHPIPSYRHYISTPAHFAISPAHQGEGLENNWVLRPIPKERGLGSKTIIPKPLVGARREAIEKLTRIEGVSYIHHTGFLILADTEEAAIRFAEFCLNHP